MGIGTRTLIIACAVTLLCSPLPAKKKKPEDVTQTLDLPKDPPSVITADPHRMVETVLGGLDLRERRPQAETTAGQRRSSLTGRHGIQGGRRGPGGQSAGSALAAMTDA